MRRSALGRSSGDDGEKRSPVGTGYLSFACTLGEVSCSSFAALGGQGTVAYWAVHSRWAEHEPSTPCARRWRTGRQDNVLVRVGTSIAGALPATASVVSRRTSQHLQRRVGLAA